ncbi:unnamed protein product [Caenorhabditis brenneri]
MSIMFVLSLLFPLFLGNADSASFSIDTTNHQFLLDGEPFTYLAGEVHYFRIPTNKWEDRLNRVRSMGFNAITVPVPWNLHQPNQDSSPDFSGNLDLVKFIKLANEKGLYTLIRLGPYISDEWENGGLPWWLIKNSAIKEYRSSDAAFMQEVTQWWNYLLPKIEPLLRKNGGPILMAQIEHYYGLIGICDLLYILDLANLAKKYLGNDVVLYSVDIPMMPFMRCGIVPGILPTIEMQPNSDSNAVNGWFEQQQVLAGGGPRVGSQFLLGSYKLWGLQKKNDSYTEAIIMKTLQAGWNLNASMSFHMAHGGTNFGFWNGNTSPYPVTTSYDSYAPISEGGDTTELLLAIRNFISKIPNWPNPPTSVPSMIPKTVYSDIILKPADTVLGFIKSSKSKCWQTEDQPMTAEDVNQGYGFVYYQAMIPNCGQLNISTFSDDAYVFLNGQFVGALYSKMADIHNNTMNLQNCNAGLNTLEIVVENTGRSHTMYPSISKVDSLMDTYIDTRGWGKGFITVNQYNIGRYWSTDGPQQTLYLPSEFLQKGSNNIIFYEFEGTGSACSQTSCTLKFSRFPIFNY